MNIENNDFQLHGGAKQLDGPPGFSLADGDEGSTRLVRPWSPTAGGRTPRYQIAFEALVIAEVVEPYDFSVLVPECQAILQFCHDWRSVAEISAVLRIPLGPARVLVADLAAEGYIRVSQREETPPDRGLLERVRAGLGKVCGTEREVLMNVEYRISDALTVDEDAGFADVKNRVRVSGIRD